jgi:Kelch motif
MRPAHTVQQPQSTVGRLCNSAGPRWHVPVTEASSKRLLILCKATRLQLIVPQPCTSWSVLLLAGKIVVAGGMDGGKNADTVQRYDWDAGKWISLSLPPEVSGQRSFLAACVVQHPLA